MKKSKPKPTRTEVQDARREALERLFTVREDGQEMTVQEARAFDEYHRQLCADCQSEEAIYLCYLLKAVSRGKRRGKSAEKIVNKVKQLWQQFHSANKALFVIPESVQQKEVRLEKELAEEMETEEEHLKHCPYCHTKEDIYECYLHRALIKAFQMGKTEEEVLKTIRRFTA